MTHHRSILRRTCSVALACTLGFAACGSDDATTQTTGAPTLLPIGSGDSARSATGAESAMADSSMMLAYLNYVAGDGIEPLGGAQTVFRLEADDGALPRLAELLGVEGEVDVQDFVTRIADDDASIESYDGQSWNYFSNDPGLAGVSVSCDSDGRCPEPAPIDPASLGSEADAEATARSLVEAATDGVEVVSATVTPTDYSYEVEVRLGIDGQAVDGLSGYVSIGEDGDVTSAGGPIGTLAEVGAFDTITTGEAIDRLNAGGGFGPGVSYATDAGVAEPAIEPDMAPGLEAPVPDTAISTEAGPDEPVTLEAPAPPTTIVAPTEPAAPPECVDTPTDVIDPSQPIDDPITIEPLPVEEPSEPLTVVLTEPTRTRTTFSAWDGSGTYIVPSYSFTGDDGGTHTVVAISDEAIAPYEAPSVTTTPPGAGIGEDGVGQSEPGNAGDDAPVSDDVVGETTPGVAVDEVPTTYPADGGTDPAVGGGTAGSVAGSPGVSCEGYAAG